MVRALYLFSNPDPGNIVRGTGFASVENRMIARPTVGLRLPMGQWHEHKPQFYWRDGVGVNTNGKASPSIQSTGCT